MSLDIKAIFKKYLDHGKIIEKDKLTLDNWYELEEATYEAKKLSGDNHEKWNEFGAGRMFDCLMDEIKGSIIKLGGKVLAEREREREREQKEVSWLWKACPSFR